MPGDGGLLAVTPSQLTSTALLPFLMQQYSSISEEGSEQSSCWKTSAKSTFLLRPTITKRARKTASRSYTVFPLTFTPRSMTCIVVRVFFIGWCQPPGRGDAKLVFRSCPIYTTSCTLTSVSETTCPNQEPIISARV